MAIALTLSFSRSWAVDMDPLEAGIPLEGVSLFDRYLHPALPPRLATPTLQSATTWAEEGSPPAAATGSGLGGKSPPRAVLMSALVPGSGEFYLGARRKAALFFGIEVVAWALYLNWDSKGNDIEDEFRRTADAQFDPFDYIAWRERESSNSQHSSLTHDLPCETYLDIYEESDRSSFGECAGSEVQQYYELIGKYDQFVAGWSDLRDANGNPVTNPVLVDSVSNFDSDIRQSYEDRRDDSNRYLKRAISIAGLSLINHVFSAIDAGRTARGLRQGEDLARIERRTRFFVTTQSGGVGSPSPVPILMALKRF